MATQIQAHRLRRFQAGAEEKRQIPPEEQPPPNRKMRQVERLDRPLKQHQRTERTEHLHRRYNAHNARGVEAEPPNRQQIKCKRAQNPGPGASAGGHGAARHPADAQQKQPQRRQQIQHRLRGFQHIRLCAPQQGRQLHPGQRRKCAACQKAQQPKAHAAPHQTAGPPGRQKAGQHPQRQHHRHAQIPRPNRPKQYKAGGQVAKIYQIQPAHRARRHRHQQRDSRGQTFHIASSLFRAHRRCCLSGGCPVIRFHAIHRPPQRPKGRQNLLYPSPRKIARRPVSPAGRRFSHAQNAA